MKQSIIFIFIFMQSFILNCCPCVGTVNEQSPPFFLDECYLSETIDFDTTSTAVENDQETHEEIITSS
ncbi:MAG: hypothetical protein WDZ41_05605 [Candidatus Babeliales bacterium]